MNNKKIKLIFFHADWCSQCKMMEPLIDKLVEDNNNVEIVKIDAGKDKGAIKKHELMGLPTLILEKDNIIEKQFTGPCFIGDIQEAIDSIGNESE